MHSNESGQESIRRVFTEVFSVRDIAEPLVSFDGTLRAVEVREFMETHGYEVVGVRGMGQVIGFARRQDLEHGTCHDHISRFDDHLVIPGSAPLTDVVAGLTESPRMFIKILGFVGGIVTRTDLQKPPVRMWLFGMVTLIEMRFSGLISQFCPDESWRQYLSEGRIKKAEVLLQERARREQELTLLDCLQFSDKGQIVARNAQIRQLTSLTSRRMVEDTMKALERLRNNLAHSQDIITSDWDIIVRLAENLDRVVDGPPGLRNAADSL